MTVPSIHARSRLGQTIAGDDDSVVSRVIANGRPACRLSRVLVHGTPTVQDVFPVRRDGKIVAAVVCEMGVIEHERQRRKSPVYRRAQESFRAAALDGHVRGAAHLSRLGEHDGPLVVDSHGRITYISSVAESLYRKLGHARSLLGETITALQANESTYLEAVQTDQCIERTVAEGSLVWTRWALPLPAASRSNWLLPIPRWDSHHDAAILVVRDATDEHRKAQESRIHTAMIQEIHHRVKNNLQTVASLLRLQARRAESAEASDVLRQTIHRILSIALVHEFLSHEDSNIISVREVCQRLLNDVTQGILDPEKRIRFSLDGAGFNLPAQQATSCALVVNELLQNTVKHAFVGRGDGQVIVRLSDDADRHVIDVIDNGRGMPADAGARSGDSLGLQIARTLVRDDLRGDFQIWSEPESGTRATISIPRAFTEALETT